MNKEIDVIIVKGEFTRDNITNDIMVQEYDGNILLLQENGETLLNIRKTGELLDLTEYLINRITNKVSHILIRSVDFDNIDDVVNPLAITNKWKSEDSLIKCENSYMIRCNDKEVMKDLIKTVNNIKFFKEKTYAYVEMYVYYK